MSSGEAKRILIARALVHDPQTLVFDEPSNSLDVFAQHGLREAMRALAQSGIGIVLVTHHLSDVIPEIDRVVLMRNGKFRRTAARKTCWSQSRSQTFSEFVWRSPGATAITTSGNPLVIGLRRLNRGRRYRRVRPARGPHLVG